VTYTIDGDMATHTRSDDGYGNSGVKKWAMKWEVNEY
jgi:hypothetical protein